MLHAAADGGIASSTSQALAVLRRMFARPGAVQLLFAEGMLSRPSRLAGFMGEHEAQAVRMVSTVTRILDLLKQGLTARSQGCKDPSLAAIFLMNNVNFIVKSIQGSTELGGLGADWVDVNRPLVQQHAGEYFRACWQPLLLLVRDSPQGLSGDGKFVKWDKERVLIKERFTRVNADISSLHSTQKAWVIPDAVLKASIKEAINSQFLPAYQGFLQRFRSLPFSKTPEKYLRYQVEDIKQIIQAHFFEGKG